MREHPRVFEARLRPAGCAPSMKKEKNVDKNKLNITITGVTMSGKSTVAHLIRQALEDQNIIVNFHDEPHDGEWEKSNEDRLKGLKNRGLLVDIATVQAPRG
jgi:predicted AAA+ superfamily ATPase